MEKDLKKCETLFQTIGEVIGRSARATLSLQSNFYELGGNSLNSIFTVAQLRSKGYYIDISDFISSKNLREVLLRVTETVKEDNQMLRVPDNNLTEMTMELLATQHKADTIRLVFCLSTKTGSFGN